MGAERPSQAQWIDEIAKGNQSLEGFHRQDADELNRQIKRLQTLRDLYREIASAQDEQEAASIALKHLRTLTPGFQGGGVWLAGQSGGEARLLALEVSPRQKDFAKQAAPIFEKSLPFLKPLEANQSSRSGDIGNSELPEDTRQALLGLEMRSFLSMPIRSREAVIGICLLTSHIPQIFTPTQFEDAQEAVEALAQIIDRIRQQRAEGQRRQEAEAMRDIMAALAGAGNLNQTLQIVLVNLQDVIYYDRAGLYLLDENQHYVLAEKTRPGQEQPLRTYHADDPLVAALQEMEGPIVVEDIQADPRFAAWPDMQSVRGWMGSPLLVGDEMIGFLSLGSLEPGTYGEADAAMIQAFTRQIAQVLENAWLHEQSHRRTEELEVLSTITFAIGQAETSESTLAAIIDQITKFFEAERGTFLFPEKGESQLVIKFSQDEDLLGMSHSRGDDSLWQAFESGEPLVIRDIPTYLQDNPQEIFSALFQGMQSAVLAPLSTQEATYGLLSFAFPRRRYFLSDDINLINAIAEISGTSLRRAVALEALEKQVNARTKHLATLYDINAIASEPLDIQLILDQLLKTTLQTMRCQIGAIHLIDAGSGDLFLAAHNNIPGELLPEYTTLKLTSGFWKDLVASSNPLVVPDIQADPRFPDGFRQHAIPNSRTYIGTPIRAKGQPLGLLSIFGESILDYTIEDITLFMTIADQIGVSVERSRLIRQAKLAAVMEERQRLARELHDSVTQLLYSQVLFAGAGLKVLDQGNLALLKQHLTRIDVNALQALKEMRLLVYELRPSGYLEEGLVGALQRRLDAVEKRTGMNARLSVDGVLNLDESTEMTLYRIAQEALNNTLKHAGAKSVSIHMRASGGQVVLEIADDGCGFDVTEKLNAGGMGLANMYERTAALGGSLIIQTQPAQGTRILVTIEDGS